MSRVKSSKNHNSNNSLPNPDNYNYLAPSNINQLSIDQDYSSSYNHSQYLKPDVPASYTVIQVGSHTDKNSDTSRGKKTDKNKRKKSWAQPNDALVIKQVDQDFVHKVDHPEQVDRLKSQAYHDADPKIKQPNFLIDMKQIQPSTAQPSVKISRVERYEKRQGEGTIRSSRNAKSSKPYGNSNVIVMSISDSTEQRKFQAQKRNQELQLAHNSSDIIMNDAQLPNFKNRAQYMNQIIPEGRIQAYNYLRQNKCCHSFVNPEYTLSLKTGGFCVNAKKQFGYINSCYYLSVQQNKYQDKGEPYLGYLKGNFTGSEFNLYSSKNNSQQIIATICYSAGCSSVCRKMEVFIKNPEKNQPLGDSDTSLKELYNSSADNTNRQIIKLVTKEPIYNKKHDCYSINFKGKSKFASIKNMVLIQDEYPDNYILMFCKIDSHQFHLEATNPMTPLIAFSVVLSGFDFKLCCQ